MVRVRKMLRRKNWLLVEGANSSLPRLRKSDLRLRWMPESPCKIVG